MRILVVEDERPAARRLCRLIEQIDDTARILAVLDSITSTLDWLDHRQTPDLLLMDIELLDGSVFEIFERRQVDVPVIFCTAYDEHAIRAFKVNSVDYLLKPVTIEALEQAFLKLRRLHNVESPKLENSSVVWPELAELARGRPLSRKSSFVVKKGSRLYPVSVDSVTLFFSQQKIVRLIDQDGEAFLLDLSLDELEHMVEPDGFFRISRQVLMAYSAIATVRIDAGRLYVETARQLPSRLQLSLLVSRDRSSAFRAWLDR